MYNQNTLSERVLLLHSELLILFHHYVLFFTYKKKQIKMYLDVKNVTGPTISCSSRDVEISQFYYW